MRRTSTNANSTPHEGKNRSGQPHATLSHSRGRGGGLRGSQPFRVLCTSCRLLALPVNPVAQGLPDVSQFLDIELTEQESEMLLSLIA